MENQRKYWSRFINQRLEMHGDIDRVLKEVAREQDMIRRNTRYILAEFKNWNPLKEAQSEHNNAHGHSQPVQR